LFTTKKKIFMPSVAVKKEKKNKSGVTVDENMRDYSNDPYVKKKAETARAFLKKHGVPKSSDRKK
jgi:hypothetical protein